jgi:hypothetical protein
MNPILSRIFLSILYYLVRYGTMTALLIALIWYTKTDDFAGRALLLGMLYLVTEMPRRTFP